MFNLGNISATMVNNLVISDKQRVTTLTETFGFQYFCNFRDALLRYSHGASITTMDSKTERYRNIFTAIYLKIVQGHLKKSHILNISKYSNTCHLLSKGSLANKSLEVIVASTNKHHPLYFFNLLFIYFEQMFYCFFLP